MLDAGGSKPSSKIEANQNKNDSKLLTAWLQAPKEIQAICKRKLLYRLALEKGLENPPKSLQGLRKELKKIFFHGTVLVFRQPPSSGLLSTSSVGMEDKGVA